MQLPEWWISTLACPRCKGPLTLSSDELHCPGCRLAYPIRDGVPELLQDEARPLPSAS
ncbi:Trm112 family protein [Vitiosangium sp. GDMCC 1.1324]|uniref:Trm112 family protein n=1 Tax=Vitiosangium sp. (strain GDMCC 1.1324) TaxID=2138576 RepID=UPI000D39B886|nr:Trm112 family protein [Vitiosangium sp. GDMCC 1.1324]PTL82341.1 hypothetical protein DAT35_16085 [Vitiosangium sp. GDMCC 1.1324]